MKTTEDHGRLRERQNHILSTISHDLKSPVSAMIGFANLLIAEMEREGAHERQLGHLARIARAGDQALELIDSILDMARLEAGKEPIAPEWIDDPVSDLADAVTMFQMEAEAKVIDLTFRASTAIPRVYWDMRHIRYRALNNVISNALKFTPKGGSVQVSASARDGWVTIYVADTGPGIPKGEEERIFKIYEQATTTSVPTNRGVGLGLANARHFVELSGGRLTAQNRNEGGALFAFALPLIAHPRETLNRFPAQGACDEEEAYANS